MPGHVILLVNNPKGKSSYNIIISHLYSYTTYFNAISVSSQVPIRFTDSPSRTSQTNTLVCGLEVRRCMVGILLSVSYFGRILHGYTSGFLGRKVDVSDDEMSLVILLLMGK